MSEDEIRSLSNVDLLSLFHGPQRVTPEKQAMRDEILIRMDAGTVHRADVPMHPSEYRR